MIWMQNSPNHRVINRCLLFQLKTPKPIYRLVSTTFCFCCVYFFPLKLYAVLAELFSTGFFFLDSFNTLWDVGRFSMTCKKNSFGLLNTCLGLSWTHLI